MDSWASLSADSTEQTGTCSNYVCQLHLLSSSKPSNCLRRFDELPGNVLSLPRPTSPPCQTWCLLITAALWAAAGDCPSGQTSCANKHSQVPALAGKKIYTLFFFFFFSHPDPQIPATTLLPVMPPLVQHFFPLWPKPTTKTCLPHAKYS